MAFLTPPTYELNHVINGDLDVLIPYTPDNGTGTIYVRNGGLFVNGLTDLDQTTINTTDGEFNVLGPNKISFQISGGPSSSIEMTADTASYWTTTAGTLTLNANATDANGQVSINAAGTGTNSILLNASNTTSGQITLQSAGSDQASDAIRLLATDTVGGNINLTASGNFANSVPAVSIYANNATSGQILVQSDGGSTTSDAVKILANDTTDGNVLILGRGNYSASNPAIKLWADNTTSGQISVLSDANDPASDSIVLNATGTTGGNINLTAAGSTVNALALTATSTSGTVLVSSANDNATNKSIKLLASGTTNGSLVFQANGTLDPAINVTATSGGIAVNAAKTITVDTTDTINGINIATQSAGIPVNIGTASSITTVVGDFVVEGITTAINSESLIVTDNILLLNAGNGQTGIDSGVIIRRYQTPNNVGSGDVVSTPTPRQESGAFQAGSTTPGSLVLSPYTSLTDNFYVGWWILITSGSGINQVRRIKSYTASTNTITIYLTSDNNTTVTANVAPFNDGLDLATAPAAGDTYLLYSDAFPITYYNASKCSWTIANTAVEPIPANGPGASTAAIQQYQALNTGAIDVYPQVYNNAFGTASGTTITLTLRNHDLVQADYIGISNSRSFTPAITTGTYLVQSIIDAHTFTISVPSSTTSTTTSSVTITDFKSSSINVNVINVHDPSYGPVNINGITFTQDITIPKNSGLFYFVSNYPRNYGSIFVMISDLNNTNGSFGTFTGSSSLNGGGTISRLSVAKGSDGQIIAAQWNTGEKLKIYQFPPAPLITTGTYTYRVRIFSAL